MTPQDDEVTADSGLSQDSPAGQQPSSGASPQAEHPQAPGYSPPPPGSLGLPGPAPPSATSQSGPASGGTPQAPSTAWITSKGTHNQTNFQVSHPADWELRVLPTTALVVCKKDPNAVCSFIWLTGMGSMEPGALLNTTLQFNNIQDYEIISAQPVQAVNAAGVAFRQLDQDALFTFRGERCRHHVTVIVNDPATPWMLVWSGSIIWLQAPASRWEAYRQILDQIAASFKVL